MTDDDDKALLHAAAYGQAADISSLLQSKTSISTSTPSGNQALDLCLYSCNVDSTSVLLEARASIHHVSECKGKMEKYVDTWKDITSCHDRLPLLHCLTHCVGSFDDLMSLGADATGLQNQGF